MKRYINLRYIIYVQISPKYTHSNVFTNGNITVYADLILLVLREHKQS